MELITRMRKKIGYLKRGVIGFLVNTFEKAIPIPSGLTSFSIGSSARGASIDCFRFGDAPNKVLIVAGIHGNEVGTVKLGRRLLKWAQENKGALPGVTLFIIPCLNPDGYALALKNPDYFGGGRIGRFNGNEVDLNRNFDTPSFQRESVWSFGKDYAETQKVFCGERAGSEPETRAICEFIKKNAIGTYIALHNASKDVMASRNERAQRLAKYYAGITGFHYVSPEKYAQLEHTGTVIEWCELQGINYIETELPTRWGSDWKLQSVAIPDLLRHIE